MDSIVQRLGSGELGFEGAVLEYSTKETNQGDLVVNPATAAPCLVPTK